MSKKANGRPGADREELDQLKAQVDLVELIRASGVDLKRSGQNWLGRCVFHEDDTASLSVNPQAQLWNCFGCEAGGDALRFLQLKEKLEFPAAVKRLQEFVSQLPVGELPPVRLKPPPVLEESLAGGLLRAEVLGQVVHHYIERFRQAREAQDYLSGRGLGSRELWDTFQVGYADGSLLDALPSQGPIREALRQLGLLTNTGKEHFRGCLVVPLTHPDHGVVGLYGRRLDSDTNNRHWYLPGPRRGVLHWQALKLARRVWLAESVLDAMSLWQAGVRDVTCLFGVQGLPSDLEGLLGRSPLQEIIFCLDGDSPGREAVGRLAVSLVARGLRCQEVVLPAGKDPNQVLVDEGPAGLKARAQVFRPLQLTDDEPRSAYQATAEGFVLELATVTYRITPQPPFGSRLKLTLRANRGTALYVETVNFYSDRARLGAAQRLRTLLELSAPEAERHLRLVLQHAEEWVQHAQRTAQEAESGPQPEEMTPAERAEAMEFLQAPDLVARIWADMEALGSVGEEKGKLLVYLIGLSRKLPQPLSGIIKSQSGVGKSAMTKLVEQLAPPEDVREYSRLSAQALYWMPRDYLKHKVLIIEERVGAEQADYSIRTLQSRQRLSQAVTLKDPLTGKLSTHFFEVEGPIAYLETTTNSQLNYENSTRCFEVHLDETEEQTRRIQECQRRRREPQGRDHHLVEEAIRRRHHHAQRLLEPVRVFLPYARYLNFPTRWLRTRRDNERFLCLIEVVAFLHQHQRRRGQTQEGTPFIEATLDDYRLAFELAQDVLMVTLHELSREGQELWDAIRAWTEQHEPENPQAAIFTRKDLRHWTHQHEHRIRWAMAELVEMDYVLVIAGQNGKPYQYRLLDGGGDRPSPLLGLTTPEELAKLWPGDPP